MTFQDIPIDWFERHMACPKAGCTGEMIGTGQGMTRMTTEWQNRCNVCGHVEWAPDSYPATIYRPRT